MSSIMVILINNGRIAMRELPYRHVMEILASSCLCVDAVIGDEPMSASLDAGYILIDSDSKLIVSRQDAFSIHHLPLSIRQRLHKDWQVAV